MAGKVDGLVVWNRVRGQNGYDAPAELPDDMAVAARNVVLVRGTLGQKRNGSAAQAITGTFSGYNALARFIPGQNDAAAELFVVDRSGTTKIGRVAAGTAFANLTLADNVSSLPQNTTFATLNGKEYVAYDSGVNRLHVFDPSESTTVLRRVGLAAPGAPSVANTGSGSYPAQIRYYRVQFLTVISSNDRRASNLGTEVSFTPSGSGTAARVTQPTAPNEGETHWIVYGSMDDTIYYQLSGQIIIATTTYDDSVDPDDYADGEAAPADGAFTPWPSVKFLLSTGERLMGFGAWETLTGDAMPPKNGRVYFSPVLDTTDFDDDERVSNSLQFKGYIDISRDAGAEDRAIAGPMDAQVFVWQSRGMYMLVPTSNAEIPYRRITLSNTLGAVSQWSCFSGEDEAGRACVYFLDPERGPYRYGAGGLQWCGYDVQDIWATVNLAATGRVAHGQYDVSTRRAMWWIATGASNDPDTMLVFSVREGQPTQVEGVRYGWGVWDGLIAGARCSVMFAETMGATMSRRLKPYAGFSSDLLRADDASSDTDNGTPFRSYLLSKAWGLQPLVKLKTMAKAWMQAKTQDNVEIELSLIRNYGDQNDLASKVGITAAASESRTIKRFDEAALADAFTFQAQIGDANAIANTWLIDQFQATIDLTESEAGNNRP